MAKGLAVTTVTIANGATTSTAYTLPANKRLVAIQTPSALTSTTITFEQSSNDGATYTPVYNEATLYSITTAASRYHRVNGEVFDGVRVVRLVGGSTEASARTITLLVGEA